MITKKNKIKLKAQKGEVEKKENCQLQCLITLLIFMERDIKTKKAQLRLIGINIL